MAVERALAAVNEGRPDEVWRLMPASYREDVTKLVHRFAERVDPALWNRTFELLRRSASLAETRKDWLQSHPESSALQARLGVEPNLLREHWSDGTRLIQLIATSDVADRGKLASLDLESFLSGTGRELLGETSGLTASLKEVEVDLVSVDGERARLRISGPTTEPQTHDYVRVEGKWVPEAVAEAWGDSMSRAAAAIDGMTIDTDTWSAALDRWERALSEAEAAETEQALHAVIESYLRQRPPEPAPPTRASLEGAVVVVGRVLTPEQDEALQVALNAAAADPDLAVSIAQRKGEATHFNVSHVGPLAAFAERLGEADGVTVENVDAGNRVVTIRFDGE